MKENMCRKDVLEAQCKALKDKTVALLRLVANRNHEGS
jgi:hypothetical protein